ncbi:MAG: beta-ketoacyl-[acyl-carrier-protein] synthase family protein, partial [Bacteroidetes bacterium]|nr:beta-ketoacyl-[acyl-carrier-protein] synthase family protein [Bacteroidota bacterium]
MSKVYVTGMGIISPLGHSVAENRAALAAGKCGLSHLDLFDTKYAELMPFGEIKISNEELKQQLSVSAKGVTRTTLLALHAINQAIKDSGLSQED